MLRKYTFSYLGSGILVLASVVCLLAPLFVAKVSYSEELSYRAMVTDMTGDASVQRSGKGKQLSLKMGDLLYSGDIVATSKKSSLTISYTASGRQEKWPGGMKFSVGELQTENIPSNVEVTTEDVVLPNWQDEGHMGGYVDREIGGYVAREEAGVPPVPLSSPEEQVNEDNNTQAK